MPFPASIKDNNFDLMRLAFATAVIFSHSYTLATGTETHEPLVQLSRGHAGIGNLSVCGFFLISGFLITHSWLRSKTPLDYARRRARRILPGYYVAVALTISFVNALPDDTCILCQLSCP